MHKVSLWVMVRVISFGLHSDGLPQIAFWNAESGPWSSPICGCQGDVHFMVAVRCDGERMAEGLRGVREDSRMLYVGTQIRPAAMQQPEWGGHGARSGPDSSVCGSCPLAACWPNAMPAYTAYGSAPRRRHAGARGRRGLLPGTPSQKLYRTRCYHKVQIRRDC